MKLGKLMKPSVILMAVLTALMLGASVVAVFTKETAIYTSPVFIVGAVLFLILQIACIIRFPFRIRKIGFYICHIGIVVTLLGAFASGLWMRETRFNIPVDPGSAFGVVQNEDGTDLDFGFQISVSDFSVEKYDPEYQLLRRDEAAPEGYVVLKEGLMPDRKGFYELGAPYGDVAKEELIDEAGFVDLIRVAEDVFLSKLPQADKAYEAHLDFYENGAKSSAILRVNDPHTYQGWKFYLMDYDHEGERYVALYTKHDPGNLAIGVGLWMLMAGTALMCFGMFERKEEQ